MLKRLREKFDEYTIENIQIAIWIIIYLAVIGLCLMFRGMFCDWLANLLTDDAETAEKISTFLFWTDTK